MSGIAACQCPCKIHIFQLLSTETSRWVYAFPPYFFIIKTLDWSRVTAVGGWVGT